MTCRSKKKTYNLLGDVIRVPRLYKTKDDINSYPIFIKPECGEGSRGCHRIANRAELDSLLTDEHIITEYLLGEEFTVDCFTGPSHQLLFSGGRRRCLVRQGLSHITQTVDRQLFQDMAEKINATMEFSGAWFFQCKYDFDGNLGLLEVAPRIAGAMALYRNLGINFPLLSIYLAFNIPITIIFNDISATCCKILFNKFKLNLSFDHIYCDLDDTLIQDGKINSRILSFLYEGRNAQKKLYLLTRHREDVRKTLKQYGISPHLFDGGIILLNDSQKPQIKRKADLMQENSILIDDSFRERRECRSSEHKYAFDVDMVESLLL